MKCPKCGSEKVLRERYHTFVMELQTAKYMAVVRCESCGLAARHESYNMGEANCMADEKFKVAAEANDGQDV